MATQSIATRLHERARRFVAAREGNVAVIFALAVLPVIGMMGVAIDYSRANAVKADLQSALDSTALMVSKLAPTTPNNDDLKIAAQKYFSAMFTKAGGTITDVNYNADTSTVTVNAKSSIPADFGKVLNLLNSNGHYDSLEIGSSSSVTWGISRLRVALALDNTKSMASSNKMTALKAAAKNLLTQLESAAKKDGDVYVSIIPFAVEVNVGTGAKTANWIDWKYYGKCSDSSYDNSTSCTAKKKKWTAYDKDDWDGCVMDRDKDYDVLNTTPDADKKIALFPVPKKSSNCPAAMMPLSNNWLKLKDKINEMDPVGSTNVTIGLSWAWQSLTQGAPLFAPEEDPKYEYQKVIILLTDGQNTENRWDSSTSEIDKRTKLACANAKEKGITIYTVRVMDGSQSLLQGCASNANKYFYLQSADGLVDAFKQIGTDLTTLRVSK